MNAIVLALALALGATPGGGFVPEGAITSPVYGGIPAGDIDLDGTYKLILDTDGDSYWFSDADDVVNLFLSGSAYLRFSAIGSDVGISSPSGDLRLDSLIEHFSSIKMNAAGSFIGFGGAATSDTLIRNDEAFGQFVIALGSTQGGHLVIGKNDTSFGLDYDHAPTVDPTIFLHSATSPATDKTEWISFAHNKTDGVIDVGKGDLKLDDDVNITGTLTLGTYVRNIDIPTGSATLGPTAPSFVTIGTFRCAQYAQTATGALEFAEVHVPDDWDGISDMAINFWWYAESGDAVADTETVQWSTTYRSIAEGEAYDNGTAVTTNATHTQSGAGTDKALYITSATIDYDDVNQPLTAEDELGFQIDLNEGATSYSGDPILCKVEVEYNSVSVAKH